MKSILYLLSAFYCCFQVVWAHAADLPMAGTEMQPTPRTVKVNAEFILPTDVFTITVEDAYEGVTYSLYKDDSNESLISVEGQGRDLMFKGAWGPGTFKVRDNTGQEMSNNVSTHLYWPLVYTFYNAEMKPSTPIPADGGVVKLDLFTSWGPKLDGNIKELFDRYNAGESPTWDSRIMRIYAESQETIDAEMHSVFHLKIFVAPALAPEKTNSITGFNCDGGSYCYSIYQYPVNGHLYDWDVRLEKDTVNGSRLYLTNTQYLVQYELYNYGELVASRIQEPYEKLCFDRLGPGIYTTKVSHQGFSRSHSGVFTVQLNKFIQQKPFITYDESPTITLDKEGGRKEIFCKQDSIIDNTTLQQVIQEFNSKSRSFQMVLSHVWLDNIKIELVYEPNFSDEELVVDSKFIFNGKSHVRFVQAGSGDLASYKVLSGMTPEPFIRLSGSQLGVNYQVCKDGSPIGISLAGTGEAIQFDNVPTGAIYTIRATKPGMSIGGKSVERDMDGVAVLLNHPEEIIIPYANAILTKTYRDNANSYADITYYDGLGAPSQTIYNRASPDGRNLIQPILYDDMYRDNATVLLPYPADMYTGENVINPEREQSQYYSQRSDGEESDSAYALNIFDQSGLNRIRRSYRPGDIYRTNNKFTEFQYETNNAADKVFDFKYNSEDGSITVSGYAPAAIYAKNTVIDEDRNKTVQFTDVYGNTVLERRFITPSRYTDTYYVYDPYFSRLVWVISPEGSSRLQPDLILKWDDDVSSRYCYCYGYDRRGNMCERQLPGRAMESFIYDKSGRLIFSTDASLQTRKQWFYYAYDNHNNLLRKSLIEYNMPIKLLRHHYFFADNLMQSIYGTDDLGQPRELDHPLILLCRLAHYVYGNIEYTRTSKGFKETVWTAPEDLAFQNVGFSDIPLENPRGLKTYEKLAVLGDDADEFRYVERTYYYNYKNRIIQVVERSPEGGISRTAYEYDILGNILKRRESRQPSAGADENVIVTQYTYDNRCRLIRESWELDNNTTADINYTYNALGELVEKTTCGGRLHAATAYNLQGWLVAMKVTDNGSPMFDTHLNYFDPRQEQTVPSYTGNISEWNWRYGGDSNERIYASTYDGLSRLTDTKLYEDGALSDGYVERGLSYDGNGNILTLERTHAGEIADNFEYSYDGNRLTTLSDGAKSYTYSYDAYGNMTRDGANGLDISYNSLNLIEKVERNDSILAKYSYLSDGTKFSATDAVGNGFYYAGSLVYSKQNGAFTLESAGFSGGRFVAEETDNGTVYSPHYFLTDHLGSVRGVVDAAGEVIERNDYYPFGMRWNDSGSVVSNNRYRYNGKAGQDFLEVPYIDYGARMYDPKYRLSWGGVDPLAETTPDSSPFAFSNNNPLRFVDHFGLQAEDTLSVNQIQRVVVTGERNLNPLSGGLLFILNSASSWGKLYNDAVGNTEATFEQNMNAGLDIWSQFFVGYGFSKLGLSFKGVKRAKLSKGLKLPPERLNHIMQRHGPTSQATDAGKFLSGFNKDKLINMINTTIEYGAKVANTKGRPGHIYTYDFNTTIGVTNKGNPTSVLKVVVDANNEIRTVYPYF